MSRLISVAMKLDSMIGVENGLRQTAVLLGCDVNRFFCIRSRSDIVSFNSRWAQPLD